jgi:hypothetical protein
MSMDLRFVTPTKLEEHEVDELSALFERTDGYVWLTCAAQETAHRVADVEERVLGGCPDRSGVQFGGDVPGPEGAALAADDGLARGGHRMTADEAEFLVGVIELYRTRTDTNGARYSPRPTAWLTALSLPL